MAFLVCFSFDSPGDDWKHKAIYLDQDFYKLIFQKCLNSPDYQILRGVAALDYDGEYTVAKTSLHKLIREIEELSSDVATKHKQLKELVEVCNAAVEKQCDLKIAGDMYPVLRPDRTK